MSHKSVRFTRQNGRDVCAAVGVVIVTFFVLRALPADLESDLPQELVLGLVSVGAAIFLLKRIVVPWLSKGHGHGRRGQRL